MRTQRLDVIVVFGLALLVTAPTTGDFGLTWDEPAYRYSQMLSEHWWSRLVQARTVAELSDLTSPESLTYYWPYGRFGFNFHPPLAGQANLLAYEVFGGWMKDIPARRMATVIEFAATVAILFGFLASCYGRAVGAIAATALVTMPRVYGDAHIGATDTPGLLLWAATACAFWNGLTVEKAKGSRMLVGILVGLCFLEKIAAVMVLLPLFAWLVVGRLIPAIRHRDRWAWIDGVLTTTFLLGPTVMAFREIRRLAKELPPPNAFDPFAELPAPAIPTAILALPFAFWLLRRLLARGLSKSRLWGCERPGLEIWAAILAFGPLLAWLGNPAWWRNTLPNLAHYYLLNTDRKNALPDIRIMYLGQTYLYSLPWHNGWFLIGITVPIGLLVAGAIGIVYAILRSPKDRLPLYFVVHFATLPVLRMLPTPAHDGVRLLLPSFFFLAGLSAWGLIATAAMIRGKARPLLFALLSAVVLGESTWALVRVHPYELSYYNAATGGPGGAWSRGMELSYWFDAYNPPFLREIGTTLPPDAWLAPPNQEEAMVPTFGELQSLGELRSDLRLNGDPGGEFTFAWQLAHDSKADAFSRLLFAMRPTVESRPRQLDGRLIAAIADPSALSRAWGLAFLTSGPSRTPTTDRAPLPDSIRSALPILGRFWGEGLTLAPAPSVQEEVFRWAATDPDSLRAAGRALLAGVRGDPDADRLRNLLIVRRGRDEYAQGLAMLLRARPEALTEAIEILIRRPEAVRTVLLRQPYTDPVTIGGPLDTDLDRDRRLP